MNSDVEIKTIQELIKNGKPLSEIMQLCHEIYSITSFIGEDYPSHKSWYFMKHLPMTLSQKDRDIVYANKTNSGKIVGVALTKADKTEKKICTLYVDENERRQQIATKLLEKCFSILGTTRPLITLADYKLEMFQGIIKKYNWKQTEIINGLYNDKHAELVYNGFLTRNNDIIERE